MNLIGTYAATVENVKDPEKLGRIKARVPHAYGVVGGVYGSVSTDNIPWAYPAGLPAGGSQQSGGMSWLPEIGDQVLVRFLDGEPEKPIWEWFMQTKSQAKKLKLHQYDELKGTPKRSAMVRYGHLVEWNDDGLILTTSKGYRFLLTDSSAAGNDGNVLLSSQAGNYLEFDDQTLTATVNSVGDMHLNVADQLLVLADKISMRTASDNIEFRSGSDVTVTALEDVLVRAFAELKLTSTGKTTITSGGITELQYQLLKFGAATEPFVKGATLVTFLTELLVWLAAHTHTGVTSGVSSTAMPALPTPQLGNILSAKILGE